jgi:UDP-N-acetylmuramate dehydrogenase
MIIQEWIPLSDKNWFKTGGPARFFCQPINQTELQYACQWANKHNQPLFILGEGANILISDQGFDGLVIQPHLITIELIDQNKDTVYVTIGAGLSMDQAIEWCLAHNIIGLEEFSGIPGTIGGSIYINLHYYQFLLEHFLHNAQILDIQTSKISTVSKEWFNFGYNQSKLQEKTHILLNATFTLKKVSDLAIAYARGRRTEIIRHRSARYPNKNTCGSFFRNFHEDEVTLISNGKKMIYVAYYLDKIGAKGTLQVGDAIVSYQHANMLVNKGNATSKDIIDLAFMMQQKVYEIFGIVPKPECQVIGFRDNPL